MGDSFTDERMGVEGPLEAPGRICVCKGAIKGEGSKGKKMERQDARARKRALKERYF